MVNAVASLILMPSPLTGVFPPQIFYRGDVVPAYIVEVTPAAYQKNLIFESDLNFVYLYKSGVWDYTFCHEPESALEFDPPSRSYSFSLHGGAGTSENYTAFGPSDTCIYSTPPTWPHLYQGWMKLL